MYLFVLGQISSLFISVSIGGEATSFLVIPFGLSRSLFATVVINGQASDVTDVASWYY